MRRNDDPPDNGPCHCQVCNGDVDKDECICPPCPVCEEVGRERCLHEHNMMRTPEQKEQFDRKNQEWEDACAGEAEALAKMYSQEEDW